MRHNGDDCLMMVRTRPGHPDSVQRHTPQRALRIGYTGALFKGE